MPFYLPFRIEIFEQAMGSLFICILVLWCLCSSRAINEKKKSRNCTTSSPWEKYVIPETTEVIDPERLVTLNKWVMRLGNNFEQIREAFRIAVCCRTHLHLMKHQDLPLLKTRFDFSNLAEGDLVVGLDQSSGCEQIQAAWPVFEYHHAHDHHAIGKTQFSIDESCKYDGHALLNYALHDEVSNDGCIESKGIEKTMGLVCPKYVEDTLVVQIRSGDIFRSFPPPHPHYKQPPVAFYEKIFQTRQWKYIVFVTEIISDDLMNPVWKHYHDKENRKENMVFPMNTTFQDDLHLLTCSHYLVAAHSTLFEYIIYFASHVKVLFTFQNCALLHTSNRPIVCNSYQMKGYDMQVLGNWSNSREQREYMISYNISNIKEDQVELSIKNEHVYKERADGKILSLLQ